MRRTPPHDIQYRKITVIFFAADVDDDGDDSVVYVDYVLLLYFTPQTTTTLPFVFLLCLVLLSSLAYLVVFFFFLQVSGFVASFLIFSQSPMITTVKCKYHVVWVGGVKGGNIPSGIA